MRREALTAAERQTRKCQVLVRELAKLLRDLLDYGVVPPARVPTAQTLLERAALFME